jgi:hypothetical protein
MLTTLRRALCGFGKGVTLRGDNEIEAERPRVAPHYLPRYIRPQSHKVWLLCQLQRRNASEGFAKQDHRCS